MSENNKLKVGIIFGGRSGEHAVSLMSSKFILSVIDREKYEVVEIGITRDGEWWVGAGTWQALHDEDTSTLNPAVILPVPSQQAVYELSNEKLNVLSTLDVVFPVLHGTFGEDGSLQGLLELADLAYVGPGVVGSAVAMDKKIFFDVMRANDIPVVDTVLVLRSEMKNEMAAALDRTEAQLGDYPMFVKPANLGSSVGVSKAKNRADLLEALMFGAEYDRRVIVQKGLDVREIEIAVMGNDDPQASVSGEIIPGEEFYSYDAKYHDETSKSVIPADIPADTAARVREVALAAYKACDLAGLSRVDFFMEKGTGDIYLNEINTIPGFTEISMFPLLWAASGVSNTDLVTNLIDYALARKAQRDATEHVFRRDG